MDRWLLTLCLVQGIYYTLTGVWPLVHVRSFLAVTGPKTDLWLVKTVGVLVAVIGVVIALAWWRGRITDEVALLASHATNEASRSHGLNGVPQGRALPRTERAARRRSPLRAA